MATATVIFTTKTPDQSITRPANTTTYAAGDAVSDATGDAHYTFTDMVRKNAASILTLLIKSDQNAGTKMEGELWLFNTDITVIADNAPFTITDTELLTCVGVIAFAASDWKVGGGNAICEVRDVNLAFNTVEINPQRTLYGQLVTRNAYTPASGEVITVDLVVSQD